MPNSTSSLRVILCRRSAMATLFECLLVGDDEEHLAAVGEAALDEVVRVESMLSFHDPASELHRVNREAADRPVRLSIELFFILRACEHYHGMTAGYFDPCAGHSGRFGEDVMLDESAKTVSFRRPGVRIDLGGFGKGYALDAAATLLDRFGIDHALMHGGTSSVIARGRRINGDWCVDLRSPKPCDSSPVGRVALHDAALSTSAIGTSAIGPSDIVDPVNGEPLAGIAGSFAVTETAALAEVWSTAILAMGLERSRSFGYAELKDAGWIDGDGRITRLKGNAL